MKSIVVPPDPALLESMRSLGYTVESAVADVVDNSVAAGASNVEILFSSTGPFEIAVVDDGSGMGPDEAVTAMRLAADAAGNTDTTPATRSFGVPFDDRVLRITSGKWKRSHLGDAYLGTVTTTRHRHAALTYHVRAATSVAMVVDRSPKGGRLKVLFRGHKIATISLKGRATGPVVVTVSTFGSAKSGDLKVVSMSGKKVSVDGVGVIR